MPKGNNGRPAAHTCKVQVLLSPKQLKTAKKRASDLHMPLSVYFRTLLIEDVEANA